MKANKSKHIAITIVIIALIAVAITVGIRLTNNGNAKVISSIDDISGSTVGVQLGTTADIYVSDDFEGDDAGTKIERFNKGADAIQALIQGKTDLVMIDEQPAKSYISKNPSLAILDEAYAEEEYAFAISKSNHELTEKIDGALSELKADGTISSIINNYIGSDEQKGQTPYLKKDVERTNGKLVVATNATFPPYEYYDNSNSNGIVGIDIDIMQAVCDKLGYELVVEDMEFDSIITSIRTGKADVGAAGMTVTEDRKKNVDFTDSYTEAKQVVIVNTHSAGNTLSFAEKLKQNFIEDGRYNYLLTGLKNTLIITFFAVIIGIVFGSLIAIIRTTHDRNGGLTILNFLARVYLIVIRGTPTMVQLLIIYYVVFASVNVNKVFVAIIAFGLNSAAYVAEVVRSGIMSVDKGQFEAGRSLGLPYNKTMRLIILPQALKNILPALGNEMITLLKETSISGYIGLMDLTKGSDIIRSVTYEALLPLTVVALIYLLLVTVLTALVSKLERSLRKNER